MSALPASSRTSRALRPSVAGKLPLVMPTLSVVTRKPAAGSKAPLLLDACVDGSMSLDKQAGEHHWCLKPEPV